MVKPNEEHLLQSVPPLRPFKLPAYTTPEEARQIFNQEGEKSQRFLSAEAVAEAFNRFRRRRLGLPDLVPPSQILPPCRGLIPYIAKSLKRRAKSATQRWLLFYYYGDSLAELYHTFSHNSSDKPSYCPCKSCASYQGWMSQKWVNIKGVPGYYLLDLEARFVNLGFSEENRRIAQESGNRFARAPLALLAAAWFALQLLTGENHFRLFHWSNVVYKDRGRVAIANGASEKTGHKPNSLIVRCLDPYEKASNTGVHVIRIPEIKLISSA